MKKILITGATGFVGKSLIEELKKNQHYALHAVLRKNNHDFDSSITVHHLGHLSDQTNFSEALKECETVIHTAARVHVMKEKAVDPLAEFRKLNVDATLNLARQAAQQGVKRFIFISSVKVNGEATQKNQAFHYNDEPNPQDAYALSKHEAEQKLQMLAEETGMELVIIRPPLIYGPGVKGNFKRMLDFLKKGIPLPLGAIHNKRSMVYLGNFVDLILRCIEHPQAANQVFMVCDDQTVSTSDLLLKTAFFLDKKTVLLPVPEKLIQAVARLIGKKALTQRLLGSLEVNMAHTKTVLDWQPPFSLDEGLEKTVGH